METVTTWSPINKEAQYIDKSIEVVTAIIDDWKLKYPFTDEHREVEELEEIEFSAVNPVTDFAYYVLEDVPYRKNTHDITDSSGGIERTLEKPEALTNTIFIALNTLACHNSNSALYDTTMDPGQQLEWLEN